MSLVNTSSQSHSRGQIDGAICPRKEVCRLRANDVEDVSTHPSLGVDALDQLMGWFDALETQIFAQLTLMFEQFKGLRMNMDKCISLIDGQM